MPARATSRLPAPQFNDGTLANGDDTQSVPASVFSPQLRQVIGGDRPVRRYHDVQRDLADHDIVNQMSLVDLMIQLPDVFLEKSRCATMAAGVEVRVPFRDHDLVAYVARSPESEDAMGQKEVVAGSRR